MTFPDQLRDHLAKLERDGLDLDELAIAFPRVGKMAIQKAAEELVREGKAQVVVGREPVAWMWRDEAAKQRGLFA